MGSRLLPSSLVVGALLADAAGVHRLGFWLVLLAVPCAAAAAFVGIADALDGRNARLRAVSTTLALLFLLLGSAVRDNAPHGAGVPALAISAALGAVLLYGLPALVWVLEPFVPRVRTAEPKLRASRA
jgi:hypothetical protein